jgi:hypothetical protein
MKDKKFFLNFSDHITVMLILVYLTFVAVTLHLTITVLWVIGHIAISQTVSHSIVPDRLDVILFSLVGLWTGIYVIWREFRFPVIWLSEKGIVALVIVLLIPFKVSVFWEDVLAVEKTKLLEGTLFNFGLSISVKVSGKVQSLIFRLSGGNIIFISSRLQRYDELVETITTRIK